MLWLHYTKISREKGTDSFKIIIKIDVVHAGIAKYVNTKFDLKDHFLEEKTKVIGLMKKELDEKC